MGEILRNQWPNTAPASVHVNMTASEEGKKCLQGVPHVKICFVLWMRKCICPCFRHPLCVTHTLPLNKPSLAQEAGQAWQGLYRLPPFHPQHSGSPSTRICNRLKQLGRQTFEALSVPPLKMSCQSNGAKQVLMWVSLCFFASHTPLVSNWQNRLGRKGGKSVKWCHFSKKEGSVRLCIDICDILYFSCCH